MKLGGREPEMQRRPLQQVLVKHQYRESLLRPLHRPQPSPRLTISSHRDSADEPVWYLGGDLATEGPHSGPARATDRQGPRELGDLLPWIDFGESEWRTLQAWTGPSRSNPSLLRPDRAFVGAGELDRNVLAAWPTKLTLSPDLADEVGTRPGRGWHHNPGPPRTSRRSGAGAQPPVRPHLLGYQLFQ